MVDQDWNNIEFTTPVGWVCHRLIVNVFTKTSYKLNLLNCWIVFKRYNFQPLLDEKRQLRYVNNMTLNPFDAELFVSIFYLFEAGIGNAISRL